MWQWNTTKWGLAECAIVVDPDKDRRELVHFQIGIEAYGIRIDTSMELWEKYKLDLHYHHFEFVVFPDLRAFWEFHASSRTTMPPVTWAAMDYLVPRT